MKRKTIEERATQAWGTTNVPQFCTYLLTNGEMLNGSYEGYRRDIDHREINEFMPVVNKKEYEYSSTSYVYRFMKRGNIRMNCNDNSICFEFWKSPTREQWRTLQWIFEEAYQFDMSIYIEKYNPNSQNEVFLDAEIFKSWLQQHANYFLY